MHYFASKVQFAQLFLKNPSKGINTSLDAHPFPPMLVQTHNKHRDLTNMGKNKTNSTSQSNKQDWEGNGGVAMQIPQKAAEEEEGQGHGYITKHINDTKRLDCLKRLVVRSGQNKSCSGFTVCQCLMWSFRSGIELFNAHFLCIYY